MRVVFSRRPLGILNDIRVAAIVLAAAAALTGCADRAPYTTPGVLYVTFSPGNGLLTSVARNGRAIGTPSPALAVARDRPSRSRFVSELPGCKARGLNAGLSPNGEYGLCSTADDELHEFSLSSSASNDRVVLSKEFANGTNASFAWLDNRRFAATVYDQTCPLAHLYDNYPARIATFDRSGKRLETGVCALGVVAGQHRIAIVGSATNDAVTKFRQMFFGCPQLCNDGYDSYHHTWSVDNGTSWHDGLPLAFDGNDRLLYTDDFHDRIYAEDGTVVREGNVVGVQWSR